MPARRLYRRPANFRTISPELWYYAWSQICFHAVHDKELIVHTFSLRAACIVCLLSLFPIAPALAAQDQAAPPADAAQTTAQSSDTLKEAPVELNKAYFKGYVTDLKSIVTSPARWDTSDWITATVVTGIAVGLYDNDAKIQKWVLDHKTNTSDNIGKDSTSLGFGKFTPVLVGGMYLYGHFADDSKARKTALLSVESFVLTGVFVQTLKYSTSRHRPYTDDPPHTWDGPRLNGSSNTMSFPSGHASSAFSVATVIASEYDNCIVQILAYGVATITAFDRVAHNAHWASDTFVGSAIGYFTGKAVVAAHRNGKDNRLSFAPLINDDGGLGVMASYKF